MVKEMTRVRHNIFQRVVLFVALCSLVAIMGCAASVPCTVTPVDIEEFKSDIRDVDADLAKAQARLAEVEAELADWEAQRAERMAEISLREAELERLKKASGVTVKPEEEEKTTDATAGS
jgi:septal ring factor EnvC (AmiA/AmiB activator)